MIPSFFMRITAGWLLLVSIGLLFADTFTAARVASDCCCAGMTGLVKGTCPLKQRDRPSCDDHGRRHCSLSNSDASTDAQNRRAPDSRDPSKLTDIASRETAPSAALSFTSENDNEPGSLSPSPETPPPRCA